MKNRPKSVNILGHIYKVEYVAPEKLRLGRQSDQTIVGNFGLGECEWPSRVIRLNKTMGKGMMHTTLLHEIRHGFQFESGFTQVLSTQTLEIDADSFVSLVLSMKQQKVI
jgi:hypothetical protein